MGWGWTPSHAIQNGGNMYPVYSPGALWAGLGCQPVPTWEQEPHGPWEKTSWI